MGIINDFINYRNATKKGKEVRSIIKNFYGNDLNYFVSAYAASIYDIPEVRTAIETFANIFSSIPMYVEVVDKNGYISYKEDATSRVLTIKSNEIQNATQFWKTTITQLMLNSNVFVEPIWNPNGTLKSLYPLPYKSFDIEIEANNAYITFNDVQVATAQKKYNMKDLVYLNRFSTLSGGSKNNLGLYETVIKSLEEQIVNVANPQKLKAILTGRFNAGSQLKEKDKKGAFDSVANDLSKKTSDGLAYLDSSWTVNPVNWQENDVNRDLMKFVINVVYNYFGLSDSIIDNKATEIEYEMFVTNKVKPIARMIEQELTSKLFTPREIEVGNRIELDIEALKVSTLQAKTQLFSVASRQGIMNIDEMREMLGLSPLKDGLGQMYRVSADTIDITKVNEYQAAQKGVKSAGANTDDTNNSVEEDAAVEKDKI